MTSGHRNDRSGQRGPEDPSSPEEIWFADRMSDDAQTPSPLSEVDAEFAHQLKQNLDAVFATRAKSEETETGQLHTKSGSSQPASNRRSPRVSKSSVSKPSAHRRDHRSPVWKRMSIGFFAAAAATLVMIVWPAPQSYSFDEMRNKMAHQAFVHARFDSESGAAVAWVSKPGRFAAIESADSVWLRNRDGNLVRFNRGSNSLQAVPADDALASTVFRVMSAIRGDEESTLRVERESWRKIPVDRGANIELTVRFVDQGGESIEVRFGIESKSGLPRWMQLDDDRPATDSQRIQLGTEESNHRMTLNYPTGGPTELVSLGVPSSTYSMSVSSSPTAAIKSAMELGQPNAGNSSGEAAMNAIARAERRSETERENDSPTPSETSIRLNPPKPKATNPKSVSSQDRIASKRRWLHGDAVDVPNDSVAMTQRIQSRLVDVWRREAVEASAPADNHALVRRVYLDLTGRIPRVSELRRTLDQDGLDFDALVEELLASPDFNTHMAAVWTQWLLPNDVDLDRFGGTAAFSDWLADEFRNETPYDEIVRQLVLAEGRVSTSGPVLFTTALQMKPDHLAKQTARAFLGTRIDCAMCHDHPYDDWTQADFWGYAALFARISRPSGKMEVMSPVLRVKDVGVGDVTMPDTDEVVPPKLLGGEVLKENPGSTLRRKRLADWLTNPGNRQFARATVNRVWSHFFGAGLVEPADDFGSHNPALSDELLNELAQYFVDSKFNVRALVTALVRSPAYRQSSLMNQDDPKETTDRPLFNRMPVRWLNAGSLYDCLSIATGGLSPATSPTMQLGLQRVGDTRRDSFIQQFGGGVHSPLRFRIGIPQALSMMNGEISSAAANESQSRLIRGLQAPFFSDQERIQTIFLAIVGRPPSETQFQAVQALLTNKSELDEQTRQEVLSDLAWALFNSAEFATNH